MRAFVGAFIVVAAVVAALALYAEIGDRTEVLALTRTVLAGEQITEADLRIVSISSDDDFPSVPASQRAAMVGQYARVRMWSGSLLVADSLQAEQLVSQGHVLMSVVVPAGLIPTGLREQSRLALVVTPGDELAETMGETPILVEATVAMVPSNLTEIVGSSGGPRAMVSLSVEVEGRWTSLVGSAAAISVAVLGTQDPFPQDVSGLDLPVSTETGAEQTTPVSNPEAATAVPATSAPSGSGG